MRRIIHRIRELFGRGTPSPEMFLSELASVHPGKGYSKMDRYKDFREVFLTDQGMRVLYEILSWGHMFRSSAHLGKFDPYETMFHDGERNIALQIMYTMRAEPRDRPTSTKE